ncbi:MAG: flagellar filament capping protein FliD [Thermodesulfobacteriota bacterium]
MSTNLVSGLSSGFDWRSMIDQLMEIEHRRVDLVEDRKTEYESKLSEWQSFNTQLLALKTAAEGLKDPEDFHLYTSSMSSSDSSIDASDLLSVSTSSTASPGSYSLQISQVATAEKLSSKSFTSLSEALGSSYAGDVIVNGNLITISESDDLADIRDKINNANSGTNPSGVTASIVNYGTSGYRLILSSDNTGAEGISLLNGGASDLLGNLGFVDAASKTAKNTITGGNESDAFSGASAAIGGSNLLNLSDGQSGTVTFDVTIGGTLYSADVYIDLSSTGDSLNDIATKINDAFAELGSPPPSDPASVITDTEDGDTVYRLLIEGDTISYTDSNNVLETLGILERAGVSDEKGLTGNVANTSDGTAITSETLIKDIDGYLDYTSGDKVKLRGTSTDGASVDTSLDIDDTTTIAQLLTAIDDAYGDVTTSVTADGKIQVADNEIADADLVVELTVRDAGDETDRDLSFDTNENGFEDGADPSTIRVRQLQEGNDAQITVDGTEVTSSDNMVEDVLPGVTLNLLHAAASEPTITLNIDRDIDAIMENISNFVDKYNDVAAYISKQQTYDEDEEKTGGVLFGDGTLSSVKSDLTSTLTQSVLGVSSEFSTLGLVGVNVDKEGQLSIDADTLRGYLETNFNDINRLFTSNGSTSSGELQYIDHSRDTNPGTYTVHITNAASRSTETSSDGEVTDDETLTITAGDKTADIELTSDMTLAEIVSAINTELDTVYTETLVGSESLTTDGAADYITSSTTWSEIDGAPVLENGDVISFTGTSRNGAEVTGEYTIDQVDSDTVQGFLSDIEGAFSNEVTASIDGYGRIVLTDKYEGNSQLSLEITEPAGKALNFGDIDVTPGADDGSQEGRYAMAVSASDDGNGHLTLSHDSYGSGHDFTILESRDDGLWNQDTEITVDNGEDVAGTINGEAATGSGQVLTGAEDQNNVDGLVLKYTGTDENLDAGAATLTVGVGERFERTLYSITDSYEGYVAFKQDSLNERIDDFDDQIEQMEARLDRKMEMMINRFVAMETALSRIQSQSQWLEGQINTVFSGWGSL